MRLGDSVHDGCGRLASTVSFYEVDSGLHFVELTKTNVAAEYFMEDIIQMLYNSFGKQRMDVENSFLPHKSGYYTSTSLPAFTNSQSRSA